MRLFKKTAILLLLVLFLSICSYASDGKNSGDSVINVRDFGAMGDGRTDDSAALQKAINAASNKTLFVPDGIYSYKTPLHIEGSMNIVFASAHATLKFTGTGNAVSISGHNQPITWFSGTVDISGAGAGTRCIYCTRLWKASFYNVSLIKGPKNSYGWYFDNKGGCGNYVVRIENPYTGGNGHSSIYCTTSKADERNTNFMIEGGWITGGECGAWLDNISGGEINGTAFEKISRDAIYLKNCASLRLSPGEINCGGYGINFGPGNSYSDMVLPRNYQGDQGLGYVNSSLMHVPMLQKDKLRLVAPMSEKDSYRVELSSDYYRFGAMRLSAAGGGKLRDILTWSEPKGLTIDGGPAGINLNTPRAPGASTAKGYKGEIRWDANYIYICYSTNSWKRAALTRW